MTQPTHDSTYLYGAEPVLCPECGHGIDPHGVDPGDHCAVSDGRGNYCRCMMSPNGIAHALLNQPATVITASAAQQLDALEVVEAAAREHQQAHSSAALRTLRRRIVEQAELDLALGAALHRELMQHIRSQVPYYEHFTDAPTDPAVAAEFAAMLRTAVSATGATIALPQKTTPPSAEGDADA
ncbi:hypothetical protein [Nocardia sp. CC201C]|uniref:hypothetical protein n=1 Tax=Nocardia sp. CC201C TaxID=3044575 RepID=UPI0024A894BA|nr:hypothetical protein [Nocardia sp. CC201C]